MPPSSMRETDRVSPQKPQRISGPKPGDYELGSLESRAAARAMHDAQAIDESYDRIFFGERADGEQVRLFMGKNRQVLRTEAKRGDEWVRVNDEPKPVRITSQMVQSGNVLLIFGPPPDMAMLGDDP
jgi:hypothetical protein